MTNGRASFRLGQTLPGLYQATVSFRGTAARGVGDWAASADTFWFAVQ